jgi:hypothetical protein
VAALVAYVVVTVITGAVVGRVTHWTEPAGAPRQTIDMAENARKIQSVLSSLAGFAITSLVLLITLTGGRLDIHVERTVDLIALLVVAYLGFVVGAIMYATTEPIVTRAGVNLLPAQHVIASTQFYRSILSGWLALGPLVAIVGVARLTDFVLFWLFVAVIGGWIFLAANITALGYGRPRFAVVAPAVGLTGAFLYAGLVQLVPSLRASDAVLFLTGAGAALGAAAHFSFHAARVAGPGLPDAIVSWLRPIALADAHASVVLMAFLWLALAGHI